MLATRAEPRELLEEMFATSPVPMCLFDDERRVLAVNDALVGLLERPRGTLVGSRVEDFAPNSWRTQLETDWEAFLRTGTMLGRYETITGAGEQLVAEYTMTANVRPGEHLSITLVAPMAQAEDPVPTRSVSGARSDDNGLTERERDVLWLMADGATNAQVALALGIAETTVQAHIGAVKRKLGATTRAQAVALALRGQVLDETLAGERLYLMQAIRDDSDQVIDTRLLYLGQETRQRQPQILRFTGAPMSAWYENWTESDSFQLARRALDSEVAQEREQVVIRPPWAPEGYTMRVSAIPLSHDRVAMRARQPEAGSP